MDYDQITRRVRRAIIFRLGLRLGLALVVPLTLLAWLIFPGAAIWTSAADGVKAAALMARNATIRALGGRPGTDTSDLALGSAELNLIKSASGYPAGEIRCLVVAIYFEAGRESRDAQLGVGQIVLNRARERKAPRELCRVVYNGMPNACLFEATCRNLGVAPAIGPALASAIEVGRALAGGETASGRLVGATHFHERGPRPVWSRDLFKLGNLGRLEFYSTEQPGDAVSSPALEPEEKTEPLKTMPQRRVARQEHQKASSVEMESKKLSRQVFGID